MDHSTHHSVNLNNFEVLDWKEFSLFLFTYLGMQIVAVLVAVIILGFLDTFFGTNMSLYLGQIQYASILDLIAFTATMLIFRSVREFLRDSYHIAALKDWRSYLYIIGAYIVMYFSQYLIMDVLVWEQAGSQVDLFGLNEVEMNSGQFIGWINLILLIIAFVFIAPVVEEILFRGIIFGFLHKKMGMIGATLISSVIFGLLHPGHQLSTTIMGAVFVFLYVRTKSLSVSILFHAIWNALATIGLLSLVSG